MKTFIISVPITMASGTREYSVQAESREKAIEAAQHGDPVCIDEHMEAEALGWEDAVVTGEEGSKP